MEDVKTFHQMKNRHKIHPSDERIHYLYYKNPRNLINKNKTPEGFTQEDVPFEPPKNIITRTQYDLCPMSIKNELMSFYLSVVQSDFVNEMIQHESFAQQACIGVIQTTQNF